MKTLGIESSSQEAQGIASGEQKQTMSVGEQKQTFNTLPTLVQAEFASDVNEKDKGFIITGISAMDFYLQKWFGKSINQFNQPNDIAISKSGKI